MFANCTYYSHRASSNSQRSDNKRINKSTDHHFFYPAARGWIKEYNKNLYLGLLVVNEGKGRFLYTQVKWRQKTILEPCDNELVSREVKFSSSFLSLILWCFTSLLISSFNQISQVVAFMYQEQKVYWKTKLTVETILLSYNFWCA